MNPHGYGIVAPGLRDNDWAHASHDDVWYATQPRWRPALPIAVAASDDAHDEPSPAGDAGERSTGME
jgi:hypothetical protein